jgi:hypothetical protein
MVSVRRQPIPSNDERCSVFMQNSSYGVAGDPVKLLGSLKEPVLV